MKNPLLISYAEPILQMIALGKCKLQDLPKEVNLNDEELSEIIHYLYENGAVHYVGTISLGLKGITHIEVTSKGAEVALEKRDLIDINKTSFQQMNIHAPVQNIAQVQGNHNPITQTINNTQYTILKQIIENDANLDEPKKKSLLSILEKFNTIKESGENIYELLKSVGMIAINYLPLFFSIIPR